MQYRVKNWRHFQHYRDRNPPWIKLHFEMLSSADWVTADDRTRVLALACMLVASRNEGVIAGDSAGLDYLRRVAYLNQAPNLKPLIDCGFLVPASECKPMLADACALGASVSVYVSDSSSEKKEEEKINESFHGKPKPRKRAPQDFKPDLDFAALTVPDMNAEAEAARFLDYEFKTPRSDWPAAWRSWVRKAVADGRYSRRGGKGDPYAGAI